MPLFPQFMSPRMPPEIQDLIWTIAISAIPERIIELNTKQTDTLSTPSGTVIPVSYDFTSSTPIPAPLHTCSRSRYLSHKRWTLTFPSPFRHRDRGGVVQNSPVLSRTWFDFESDILLFLGETSKLDNPASHHGFIAVIDEDLRTRVRNVAVGLVNLPRDADDDSSDEEEYEERVIAGEVASGFPSIRWFGVIFRRWIWGRGGEEYDLRNGFQNVVPKGTWEEETVKGLIEEFEDFKGIDVVSVEVVGLSSG